MLIGMTRDERRAKESEYVTMMQTKARLDGWRIFGDVAHESAA